jgi:hypothetical protein
MLARREGVKTSGSEVNLRGIGFADILPGAQQFVSDLNDEQGRSNALQCTSGMQ